MLDIHAFAQLRFLSKIRYAKKHGHFLTCRLDGQCAVSLFKVNNFFVDLWFDASLQETTTLHCYENEEYLTPFLNEIDITKLKQELSL